ncbi:MAG: hypothetical protein FJ272_22300, partial [Planctomycetes bacterium]|nr:hypothetical protein [Planctomycetota bacterium]
IFCNQRDVPLSLSGRHPFGGAAVNPGALDLLARSGTPDGRQPLDPEVAAAYLRLVPEAAQKEPYRSADVQPEPGPNGTFVMNYAALLSHRRDNWLASVHGQSKYVWGTEMYASQNRYGFFNGLGQLEILAGGNPVSAKASGREEAGWDWRRFEGTTAPLLPLETIANGNRTWMPTSPETFVGGLSHRGRQGLFAMVVNQNMPGKTTLKGRKSWFFSDERILCLGSDISCDEAEHPTQTTLCQKRLPQDRNGRLIPTCLNGSDLSDFPSERTLAEAKPHWFLDVQQTGYYLPARQKATVARWRQKSRDHQDKGDTEGDFLTAWIDHGKAPVAAGYEYALVVRATSEAMQRFAADPPYRVLQRDQAAHVVWDTAGRRWGCVFFAPQEVTPHAVAAETLQVKAVDRPCLIMVEAAAKTRLGRAVAVRDGQLDATVADPDLNLENGVSQPRPLRVTFRGAWRPLDAPANVRVLSSNAAETVLEILCQHGASYALRLGR